MPSYFAATITGNRHYSTDFVDMSLLYCVLILASSPVTAECFVEILQPKHLIFPEAMHISRNHYKKSWSLKTFRRIKNIIVLMDWVPNVTALKPQPTPPGRHVSLLIWQRWLYSTIHCVYITYLAI